MAREFELEYLPNMGIFEGLLLSVFLLGILLGHCVTKWLGKEPVAKSKFAKGKRGVESDSEDCRERKFVIFPSSGEKYHRQDCKLVLEARRKQTRLVSPCIICEPLK